MDNFKVEGPLRARAVSDPSSIGSMIDGLRSEVAELEQNVAGLVGKLGPVVRVGGNPPVAPTPRPTASPMAGELEEIRTRLSSLCVALMELSAGIDF